MTSNWLIDHWPNKGFDVFLSHVAEDRDRLILPVYEALKQRKRIPWIDQVDYPLGVESIDALRQHLVRCSHIVYFITPAMLTQGRGWTAVERTLSSLIQSQFHFGSQVFYHFQVPLIFLPSEMQAKAEYVRSIWSPLKELGITCPFDAQENPEKAQEWATELIDDFVRKEQVAAVSHRKQLAEQQNASEFFSTRKGLMEWLCSLGPNDLEAESGYS